MYQRFVFLLAALVLPSCAGMTSNTVKPSVPTKHASTHLSCDQSQVVVTKIDDTTWKAEGCGQTAVLTCWTSVGQGEGTCMKQ